MNSAKQLEFDLDSYAQKQSSVAEHRTIQVAIIILLHRMLKRVFHHLENKLNNLVARQDEQDTLLSNLCQRVHDLEQRDHIRQNRSDEIEHLQNLYSNDGEPICNYFTSRFYEEDEV